MPKLFLLALLLVLNLTHYVEANDDMGYKHYLNGDYKEALKLWSDEVE